MLINIERRKSLRKALDLLEKSIIIVDTAADEESESLENMPENLCESLRYEKMESAVESLESASELLHDAIDNIKDAVS